MFIIQWAILAAVFMVLTHFVPGIHVTSFWSAFLAAIVLSLVNIFIKPIILLLTLPATILTLGLFVLAINALMIWFVGAIVPGFTIDGFWPAFITAVVVSIVSTILF
jgi:putative membrane protein